MTRITTRITVSRFSVCAATITALVSGCYQDARICADGRVCPLGSECAATGSACIRDGCGNGALDRGEECDDGNVQSLDGCSATCRRELAAGGAHTCAIVRDTGASSDAVVRCWGSNLYSQLGRANRADVGDDEPGLLAGVDVGGPVAELAAGDNYTCALLESGILRCWGTRWQSRSGLEPVGDDEAPLSADALLNMVEVKQLAAGAFHRCALLHDGAVRCWGFGFHGRLGDGHGEEFVGDADVMLHDPVSVGGPVKQLAAGGRHTCALLESGAVRCWGDGSSGQLGHRHTSNIGDDESPSSVAPVSADLNNRPVRQIVAGRSHTCALFKSGDVRCWGKGSGGRLGYGTTENIGDDELPSSMGPIDVGERVQWLTAGSAHTCAVLESGAVRCWGVNSYSLPQSAGWLGYGTTEDIGDDEQLLSVDPVDVGGPVEQLAANEQHTCALLASGAVRCWGANRMGQLGYGNRDNIGDDEPPSWAGDVQVGGRVKQLVAGWLHTCALLESGRVRCWGYGQAGELGYGNTEYIGDDELPASLFGRSLGGMPVQVAAGAHHTCAIREVGTVHCWGLADSGRLGLGQRMPAGETASASSVQVGGPVKQVAAGGAHTCALLTTGTIRCWGRNHAGQLGYGHRVDLGDDEQPATAGDIELSDTAAVQIVAGDSHTCALLASGAVRCWGANEHGQLGLGAASSSIGDDELPAIVAAVRVGGPAVQLAAGGWHTCALLEDSTVRCWGAGESGQLGQGDTETIGDDDTPGDVAPIAVGGPVVQLATGERHTCALLKTGAVRCWGFGADGRLGYGHTDNIGDDERPGDAGDLRLGGSAMAIAAGWAHTCAMLGVGRYRCWGVGADGRLGYGHTDNIGDDESPGSVGVVPSELAAERP